MLKGLRILKNTTYNDKRGFYWTTWKKGNFKKIKFNHDKFSISKKNVLRGFHCDFKSWKLVTCVFGKVFLAIVNVNKNDRDYLKSKTFILKHQKPKSVLIPPYYANAYLCLSDKCVFHYKWHYKGKYIDSNKQKSYRWNDPKIKIKWPIKKPILSKRDKTSNFL
tara:strand:+ start:418 stop:909 length:492 start_codon:yes stop_codon:yes gene_type:complete